MLNHTNAQKSLFKTPFINKSLTNKNLANKNLPGTQFAMHEVVGKRRANPKLVGEKIEIMTPAKRAAVAKSLSAKPEAASAKLWLHIHLPQLPLDILTRGGDESRASVLCEGNGTRRKILLANSAAVRLGVRKGMPLNAAHILGDVHIFEPNEVLEKKALRQLCHWALQFSPVISEVDNDGLLIEIKGSIKLFNGIERLIAEVKKGLKELGYKFSIAVAPTPLGATALARSGKVAIALNDESMVGAVSDLPLAVLRLPAAHESLLDSVGARTIGDCLRLPRGGVGRRASPELVKRFDQLCGRVQDPRSYFTPAKLFQSHIDLPWETHKAQTLMMAGERLLQELTGYLRGLSGLANSLRWTLQHTDKTLTHFQLELVKPSRDVAYFAMLLREKIARLDIREDVQEIALYVDQISEEQILSHADLFDSNTQLNNENLEDWPAFIDRLRTRLGERAVKKLKAIADHRPECAWRWQDPNLIHSSVSTPISTKQPLKSKTIKSELLTGHSTISGKMGGGAIENNNHAQTLDSQSNEPAIRKTKMPTRPVWLMRRPLRIGLQGGALELNGPLKLQAQRERIETGWWDGKPIGRDYFVASNPAGAKLWVYRELAGNREWYLHGIFD
jgi:protein ImuB